MGPVVVDRSGVDALIEALAADGYVVVGPTERDGAIVLAELRCGAQLPDGIGVDTAPGHYRTVPRADGATFAHSAGPQSWKQFLHPPRQDLWSHADGHYVPATEPATRWAFLGVRGCDLAAIATLSAVLSLHTDVFVVAVGCTEPGALCFCASAGTGPAPGGGYDVALTELVDATGHWFLAEAGSDRGSDLLGRVPNRPATEGQVRQARDAVATAEANMGRSLPEVDVRELLRDNPDSPRWADVAQRCVACGNCTLVCPTCFCTTTEDVTDLDGAASRSQRWASCFERDFSFIHGGPIRKSVDSRYRQWLTHKLSTWHDQFGRSGCVGCGRCIAWCPVGIDITEEIGAINDQAGGRT
jgi:ferredoxin